MPTTRGHTSIRHLLKLANVDVSHRWSPIPRGPPLPPRLDVEVDDADIRKRKEAWDAFMQWTLERRFRVDASGKSTLEEAETYPYAFADRDLWLEDGGFCGEHGHGDDRCSEETGACSVSGASAMSNVAHAIWSSASEADRTRLDAWGLRGFFEEQQSSSVTSFGAQ
jgi:hypothetical protein